MSSIILNPFQLLEINIISAQDLAKVSRSMRTYAIAWVHPDRKLSTRVDPQGRNHPTWNDKFVFRVDEDFLLSDTSGVMIEIYSVNWFKDVLVGTVRILVGNLVTPPSRRFRHQQQIGMKFVALQVRRPSGRPQGILNIGVTLLDSSMRSMPLYTHLNTSAVGYRDLMGEHDPHNNQHLLHHHNHNQNQQLQQQQQQPARQQPLALPAPKPELRRTKSDTSSMMQAARPLKRKVSFRERLGSVVGIADLDPKTGPSTVLSVSDVMVVPAERGKSSSPISDVGSGSIVGAVRNKWLGRTEGQQKQKTKPKPKPKQQPMGFDPSIKGMPMTDSELGPSPSEVAAKNVYRIKDGERSEVGGWSQCESVEGLQSKLERWKMELPAVYDNRGGEGGGAGDYSSVLSSEVNNRSGSGSGSGGGRGRSKRRNKRRQAEGGGGLFSCAVDTLLDLAMSDDGNERLMMPELGGECPPGLELGLGLGYVRAGKSAERARILTAQDLSSRADVSPTSASQVVVGWPPVGAYRMNSLVSVPKAPRADGEKSAFPDTKTSRDGLEDKAWKGDEAKGTSEEGGRVRFAKVYMDGVPIGRKVDLNAHSRYETLARALADMFLQRPHCDRHPQGVGANEPSNRSSASLLDDSSKFVLTYKDKEGDWLLVGDVPWEMFLAAVRRLKIMRTSETKGLGSRLQERSDKKGRRKHRA